MNRRSITLAVALLVLVGCERQSPPPEAAIPPRTISPIQGSDRVEASDIPGVFVAKGMRLELLANGRYRMRVHAESAKADIDSQGSWSLLDHGETLRLAPDDSSEPMRDYMAWSKDAFESSDGSYSLVREGK